MKQFTNLTIHPKQNTFLERRRGVVHKGQPILKHVAPRTRHACRFKALQKGELFILLPFVILVFAKLSAFVASLLSS